MSVAALVLVLVVVALTAASVIGLFIWGAVKDGEEDKAVQARLGIRRSTRLGRSPEAVGTTRSRSAPSSPALG